MNGRCEYCGKNAATEKIYELQQPIRFRGVCSECYESFDTDDATNHVFGEWAGEDVELAGRMAFFDAEGNQL